MDEKFNLNFSSLIIKNYPSQPSMHVSFQYIVSVRIIFLLSLLIRFAGQVGFVVCGIRNSKDAQIGDTFFHPDAPVEPLKGFKPMRPMVRLIIIKTLNTSSIID